jgi:hypothetical protein
MDRVLGLSERALVGKFLYRKMNFHHFSEWLLSFWKPILGYCPRFILLANHWMVFHFLAEEELLRILSTPWIFGKGVLTLKRWSPSFNPYREHFTKRGF